MKVYRAEQIRNVALISHVGAGKTSLVDAALFDSGAVTRQGKVDEGSSISDYDPDELKRHMSLNAKVLPVEWKNHKINFIDTPGYADFLGEVKAGLRVADATLAERRLDGERAEQQRLGLADADRREPHRADQQGADARGERQLQPMAAALAQPVGRFGVAAGAEGALVQALDRHRVVGRLRQDGQ